MASQNDPAFERFVLERKKRLQHIASHTRGEYQLTDVVSEAWLMADTLAARKGMVVDFANEAFQDLLLRHLYQALVRYTELNVRHAVRLDHAARGSDGEDDVHPLMRTLPSDEGRDPLADLLRQETESQQDRALENDHSLAGAYVGLLRHFDNQMDEVANHLLISKSYAYQRCAHARLLAVCQCPVPLPIPAGKFMPKPWRRFRIRRNPEQLAFDFDEELPLEPRSDAQAESLGHSHSIVAGGLLDTS